MGISMQISGGINFNVSMIYHYQENGFAVFYVRPFSEELKADLDRLMSMKEFFTTTKQTNITEINGTYRIASEESLIGMNFMESFWGMLFRRFCSESKRVCLDSITEEKYYGAIISYKYIEPCARKLAA